MSPDLQPLEEALPDLAQLAAAVLQRVADRDATLTAAESCTGGLIAATLTGIEGLSGAFVGGFVTYCDETKSAMLGIPADDIARYDAVSPQIALAMVTRARDLVQADFAVAVTGFTGEAGGNENGLVHIAVADKGGAAQREFHFGEVDRNEGRAKTAEAALAMLADLIDGRLLASPRDEPMEPMPHLRS